MDRNNVGGSNTAYMSDTGTDSQTYDNIYKRTGPSEKLEG